MTRPTRRLLLGASAALAAPIVSTSVGAVPSPDADARLIEACTAYRASQARSRALEEVQEAAQEAANKAREAAAWAEMVAETRTRRPLLETIIYIRASTPAGREAKALAAMWRVSTMRDGSPMGEDDGLLWSLAEDLAGRDLEAPL